MTISATFDLAILYFVAATVVVLAGFVVFIKTRAYRQRAREAAITRAVAAFFRDKGDLVESECVGPPDRRGFTLLVESTTSRRFRHSHIVEMVLRDHVREACGLELHRVFWRFPIKTALDSVSADQGKAAEAMDGQIDEYLYEGMARLKDHRAYEVSEGSLETFQALADHKPGPKAK